MAINESGPAAEPGAGPDAKIPLPLATGLGLQLAALVLPGAVLIPTIMFRGAGQPDQVLLWAVFASVIISGLTTMLQAARFGRLGGGYLIATGASGATIGVSIAALDA
ncbi:MAG: hypothetical protein F4Z84_05085, partial [Gammaproteobacteria bacterium]|nr:hypothetical protein [Gammaproteobacteria bacterium]